ncbi:MAG TPA: hypothetical protein VFS92_09380, partial [Planctomycetota bacterium]|nr:hypothetical protein [Planctomycetota bacterium]
ERGFPFAVLVRDRAGRPLDGISVSLTIGEADPRTLPTDAEGVARFRRIPAGPLHIEASIQGPGGAPGATATATASTEQGRAELVLDIGGEALLRVKGWDGNWSGLAYFARATDLEPTQTGVGDDGTVRLRGLEPGQEYIVYIRASHPVVDAPGCALVRGVRAGEPPREIELVEGRDITGRVNLPEGADGFAVAALVGQTVMIDGHALTADTFRIPIVPEGTWTVVVYLTTEDGKYHAATGTAAAGGSVEIRVP